jgi:two-component system, OmpR family, response regulator
MCWQAPLADWPFVSPDLKVLVVDDEPLICWSLSEALRELGFDVAVAGDGLSAVGALVEAASRPDVVLLDYRLPDSDGLTLFTKIRTYMPAGRVILMTAYGTPEVTSKALALGAYRVVTKPFDVTDVATMIRHAHAAPPA